VFSSSLTCSSTRARRSTSAADSLARRSLAPVVVVYSKVDASSDRIARARSMPTQLQD
jgi:hypothetical protein